MAKEKVEFEVTKPVVIPGNRFKGPGKRMMDPADAEFIHNVGCGRYVNSKDEPAPVAQEPEGLLGGRVNLDEEARKLAESSKKVKQALPEDFPNRKQLEDAGYVTVEDLQVEGIEDKLKEIQGIGPAALKKIGLALNELI